MKKSFFYCSEFDWKRKACICPTTAFMRHPILWYGTSERGNVVKFVKDWWGGWKNWQRWGNFLQQKEIEKKSNLIDQDFSICHTCHSSGRSLTKVKNHSLVVSGSSIYLKNWNSGWKTKSVPDGISCLLEEQNHFRFLSSSSISSFIPDMAIFLRLCFSSVVPFPGIWFRVLRTFHAFLAFPLLSPNNFCIWVGPKRNTR